MLFLLPLKNLEYALRVIDYPESEAPPLGTYNLDLLTLNYNIMNKIKKKNAIQRTKAQKDTGIGFDSKSNRFRELIKEPHLINIGPGKYDSVSEFDEKIAEKKRNLLSSRTERFLISKESFKLAAIESYVPKNDYIKKSFNVLFPIT